MQKLKLKRIYSQNNKPNPVMIHTIGHVYLNNDKFKIYIGKHEKFVNNTELYLVNLFNNKWYKFENEKW